MKAEGTRTCLVCGTQFPLGNEFCPVCMLREALNKQVAGTLFERGRAESTTACPSQRFEHYELAAGEDGKPVELGRGAMGVTYKAFDVDLRCPVALKVISERYLGDESAELRFLREARAAAKLRHSNVASVLHLGRTGSGYFYAMEFVEGETLEKLIKRVGRLEVKLALEIATQVAAGLAAVHEQNLVHRDIKPTNIMVRLKEEGSVTVKIIDLGLAKTLDESASQAGISSPGAFVGTPEFASPEQFAGVGVDIRSDLYSLGVTLWEMVAGRVPFGGSPAEVMYQHQRAPLPLEQLRGAPQPVIVLVEVLLEKDPAGRIQNPAELLKVMPTVVSAFQAGRRITRHSLQKMPPAASPVVTRKPTARLGQFVSFILGRANVSPSNTESGSPVRESRSPGSVPKRISIARLPVTGSDVFGREQDIAFLDTAWVKEQVNIVTIVAWAGVGKSTLVNHWLGRMAAEHYRSAELVFGWSFYRQGSSGDASSADEFLDAALAWFGDPDPRLGTAWEKGERLAKLIAHHRTLLVLDGLEPLQNPPGPQEGRVREPSLQALLRELAAFNMGLCVITTRMPVADLSNHERTSVLRRDLEQLSSDAGAKLLQALGVKGHDAELRSASDEFSGHCLALTLLGSYLTDAYNGEIRFRKEVSARLAHDERQGAHARRVMKSYQTWLGEGPELSVLRMLGLFDRPADEKALEALLKPPAIRGLTTSLTRISPLEWRTILAKLRRSRLLAGEDPHNPGQLDTHPLVREYFGEQLRTQRTDAWKECNRRLYNYYRTLAPQLPDTLRAMEPLFLAAIFGCNAGLFRDALYEVYIPRIQRGNASFAANILGARGALLSVLIHFFEHGRWGSPVDVEVEGQELTVEDQLFVLMQTRLYLTATRGLASPEARICCERAESLCRSLGHRSLLYSALKGQYFYSLMTANLTATLQIAKRLYSLAQEHNDPALIVGAYECLASALYFCGDFDAAHESAALGVQIWRSGREQSQVEELMAPGVVCLCYKALSEWHLGEAASYQVTMAEAVSVAKQLHDMHALVLVLYWSTYLACLEGDFAKVGRLASDLMETSMRLTFATWLPHARVLRGWARSVSGSIAEGMSSIEDGIVEYRAAGAILALPFFQILKAEALHLASRTSEALAALEEGETVVERSEARIWCSELYRLRGVFLAAICADEAQIEASFREAIRIAHGQKSISLAKRAEASYLEYRRQKGKR
jgi:serine/threonine protein kinase/predicted ATPase